MRYFIIFFKVKDMNNKTLHESFVKVISEAFMLQEKFIDEIHRLSGFNKSKIIITGITECQNEEEFNNF